MAEENNINLDCIEPAACFDNVKAGRGKAGRPRKRINDTGVSVIIALARVMCTEEEIAACLGVKTDTLYAEHNEQIFLEALKKGREHGKMSLRRHQFELSKTNATMAIWLGKQYLGQRDVIVNETEGESKEEHNITFVFADTSSKGVKSGE
ncbi:MAG: hypothetical protein IJY65_04255 [Clostridia bacterium]|nr:hypothetical protein [Clostridia bacterium]